MGRALATCHSAILTRRGLTAGMIASFVPRTTFAQASADAEGSAAERLGAGLVPIVQQWQQDSPHTPGIAVGVKLANGAAWNEGFGVADLDTAAPMPPDDYMGIGSVTKTSVGTVVLQLFDEGALNLDDPLSAYISGDIPPIPDSDRITL